MPKAKKPTRVWYVAVYTLDDLPNNGYGYGSLEEAMREGCRDLNNGEEGTTFYIARVTVEQPSEYRVVTGAEYVKEAKYTETDSQDSDD